MAQNQQGNILDYQQVFADGFIEAAHYKNQQNFIAMIETLCEIRNMLDDPEWQLDPNQKYAMFEQELQTLFGQGGGGYRRRKTRKASRKLRKTKRR